MKNIIFMIALIVVGITLMSAGFVVDEYNQAIVTQFGKIKGDPIDDAGLHWKIPFIQDVRYFEKRILTWDGDQEQIPTKDKKYIWVDTTARWRITDARKFAEALRDEFQARSKIDSILDGITRDTISNHNLVEAVRNSNAILDRAVEDPEEVSIEKLEEQITGEIESISVGRENLSLQIIERATTELARFGIELIDLQLRRIAYEKSVEEKVYTRMISERNRIAEKIRSIGKGEEAKIQGRLNRDLKKIESEAYSQSQEIKGKAEAESISIYATSMKGDPGFYKFVRSMDAYKNSFKGKTNWILSTDSEFLNYLK